MDVRTLAVGIALVAGVTGAQRSDRFARDLAAGTTLTYESEGTAQPPWHVDTVQFDATVGGRNGVRRVVLRLRPDAAPTPRAYAIEGDTLFAWSAASNQWRRERPLAARREIEVPQGANGDTARVTTGDSSHVQVGDRRMLILPTTFLTRNRAGRPVRRLTEEYAPSIATAVSGVFEVADSATGTWRVTQRFRLAAMK
jgi:hypothetical protein